MLQVSERFAQNFVLSRINR